LAVFATTILAQDAPADKPAGTPETQTVRTWTDASGLHQIQGTLIAVAHGVVRLKRADNGAEVALPLDKLSTADQMWVAAQSTSPRAAAPPKAAAPTAGGKVAQHEWPWWMGPNYDARSTDTNLLKRWPPGGPALLWKATDVGQGFSSVSVARETVYVTGEKDGKLMLAAFDPQGKRKWEVEHGPAWTGDTPGARGSAAVDDDRLYAFSGVGLLGCFDAQSGEKKWSCDAKQFGGRPGQWGYAESPLVWGRLVIFKPGGESCIVALNKMTGEKVWASHGWAAGPEYGSCLPIYYDSRFLLVAGTSEGLVGLRAGTGERLWINKFAEHNTANCPTPVTSDGYVFWANGYGKGGICLKLGPGGKAGEAWTTHDLVCHHGGYVIDNGYVYGNNEGEWSCLDLRTGRRIWSDKGVGKGSLCWADGMLYLFSEHNGQAALATCSPSGLTITGWVKVKGEGPSWAHPVVAGGRLYLRYDTNLYCFDVSAKEAPISLGPEK
jgi:outer membrane protein assembly factor BamB